MTDNPMVSVPVETLNRWFNICVMNGLTLIADEMDALTDAPRPDQSEVGEAVERLTEDLQEGRIKDFAISRDVATILAVLPQGQGALRPTGSVPGQLEETSVVGAETWETIAAWCDETFGPVTLERTAARANEEMQELLADPSNVVEAADVCIVLSRYPGLAQAIDEKMAVNRARKWSLRGDGTGYHIKPAQQPDKPEVGR